MLQTGAGLVSMGRTPRVAPRVMEENSFTWKTNNEYFSHYLQTENKYQTREIFGVILDISSQKN